MSDIKYTLLGNRTAVAITGGLATVLILIGLLLLDQGLAKSRYGEGKLLRVHHTGGTVSYGYVQPTDPKEAVRPQFAITSSRGSWRLEVETKSGIEVVDCPEKSLKYKPGDRVAYRQRYGYFGWEYGYPTCM